MRKRRRQRRWRDVSWARTCVEEAAKKCAENWGFLADSRTKGEQECCQLKVPKTDDYWHTQKRQRNKKAANEMCRKLTIPGILQNDRGTRVLPITSAATDQFLAYSNTTGKHAYCQLNVPTTTDSWHTPKQQGNTLSHLHV